MVGSCFPEGYGLGLRTSRGVPKGAPRTAARHFSHFLRPSHYDAQLAPEDAGREKVEYIHLNPVRAGLVKRAEEWQWSSVRDYAGGLSATFRPNRTLASDRVLLPADERGQI
jgi:hypothetical protein